MTVLSRFLIQLPKKLLLDERVEWFRTTLFEARVSESVAGGPDKSSKETSLLPVVC